jgi:hypothetical protein
MDMVDMVKSWPPTLVQYDPVQGPELDYHAVGTLFLVCMVFWTLTYRVCKGVFMTQDFSGYSPGNQQKLKVLGPGYIYSTINAGICLYYGFAVFTGYLAEEKLCQTANVGCSSSDIVNSSFIGGVFLMTYLTHDVFVCWFYPVELGQNGWDVFIHHFVFIFCTIAGTRAMAMPFAYSWLSLCEISTIPLNIRWMTIVYEKGDSALYHIMSYAFVLCFFAFRVTLYTFGLWDIVTQMDSIVASFNTFDTVRRWCSFFVLFLVTAGWLLQLYWFFFGILPMLFRKGKKKTEKSD